MEAKQAAAGTGPRQRVKRRAEGDARGSSKRTDARTAGSKKQAAGGGAGWVVRGAALLLVLAAVAWYAWNAVPAAAPVQRHTNSTQSAAPAQESATEPRADAGDVPIDDLGELPHVWWFGPIFSGGGYSSEAISFVLELSKHTPVRISQHGDGITWNFISGLPTDVLDRLQQLMYTRVDMTKTVVVCHSEAGAWNPPLYETSVCPPSGARYVVGRTMFETDRIPSGWTERCNRDLMSEIWVPTDFHASSFAKSGVNPDKLVVIPESVDVDAFNPDTSLPLERLPGYPETQDHFKFLSIFKWEARKGWDILARDASF